MKIYVYPHTDYYCANCGNHMYAQKFSGEGQLNKKKKVVCKNKSCPDYNKVGLIPAQEIEIEEI